MKRRKKIKAKVKTNKLNHNPLFIKLLNWKGDKYTIENMLTNISESFEDPKDKDIVKEKLSDLNNDFFDQLTVFQK